MVYLYGKPADPDPIRTLARRLAVGAGSVSPGFSRRLPQKLSGLVEYGDTYAGAYLLRRGLFISWKLDDLRDPNLGSGSDHAGLQQLDLPLQPNGQSGPFARVATQEARLYMRNLLLRDSDWSGMAHSLEISVRLVGAQLLAEVAPITCCAAAHTVPEGAETEARQAPKHALAPSRPLNEAVLRRRKCGFAMPIGRWVAQAAGDQSAEEDTYGYSFRRAERVARQATEATQSAPSQPQMLRG